MSFMNYILHIYFVLENCDNRVRIWPVFLKDSLIVLYDPLLIKIMNKEL